MSFSGKQLLAVHHGGGVGGAPVSLLKLLAGLDRRDFQPSAIFTEPGPILTYAADIGISARTVRTGGAFFYSAHARLEPRSLSRFLRTFPSAVRTARGVLRRERPDVLHLNTSVLLAWAAAARHERVPVVWVVREVLGPNRALRRWHADLIVRHARRVVAISNAVAACFPPPPPPNLERVYNAVDLTEFTPPTPGFSAQVRAELGLEPDAQVVMVIGSVQRVKGHWLVLDALRVLPSTTHLVLVTGGVDERYAATLPGRLKRLLHLPLDNLEALLGDAIHLGVRARVHVTGFRRDVARVLAAADVLVFPSLAAEGFGRPIIEAMALARPVVATDVGPSAELIGADAGRLVAPAAGALASAIAELLHDPQSRRSLGQAGRHRVEALFSLEQQVVAMSRIYSQAAALG